MVLVVAFGWWAVADLGSSTLTAEPEPIYVAGCPVADPLEKDSARGFWQGQGLFKGRRLSPYNLTPAGSGTRRARA
jgi:hypothetical protein